MTIIFLPWPEGLVILIDDLGCKTKATTKRYRYGSLDDLVMCYRLDMNLRPTPISYIQPPI